MGVILKLATFSKLDRYISVLLLYSKQFQTLGIIVKGINGMDVIFKLVTSHSLTSLFFLAISSFKKS